MARDEISAEVVRREAAPTALGDAVSKAVTPPAGAGRSAARAWYEANGDIERAHTTGTFVRDPRRGEAGPVLVVYVDSKARVTDFSANSEVYLARLANAGCPFCKVEFRLSRYPRRDVARAGETGAAHGRTAAAPLPQKPPAAPRRALTPSERDEIDGLCSELPESLRGVVSRAMSASYERDFGER